MVLKIGDGRFDGLRLKTIGGGFADLDLKTRRGWFSGFDLKTINSATTGLTSLGLKSNDESEDVWHHCKTCVETKRSHEGTGSARCK